YYSSGMYVRLAFSVAAHMEPDILLVDEVLAVGDAEFQKKCLGKMDEVTKTAGRTILFVSHNMAAIQSLCQKTILLENGKIKKIGDTKEVVAHYLKSNPLTSSGVNLKERKDRIGGKKIKIVSFHVEENGKKVDEIYTGGIYTFCFGYEAMDGKPIKNLGCSSGIERDSGEYLVLNWTRLTKQTFSVAPPKGIIKCKINQKFPLIMGLYNINAGLWINDNREDFIKNLIMIEVKRGDFYNNGDLDTLSPISLEQDWQLEKT
ncbi:ABC transporter ATP-binding protein, partial [bacterium (Candidatus Gribaldobacteria) CG_4_10_14_0_2_um_filter_41_16]